MAKILHISYTNWKAVVQNNGWPVYTVLVSPRDVFAGTKDLLFHAQILPSEVADYDATFGADDTEVPSQDDAEALIIGLSDTFLVLRDSQGAVKSRPHVFADGLTMMFAGAGDDIVNGVKFDGQDMAVSSAGIGDTTVEWQFKDTVWVVGGHVEKAGADIGDHLTYEIHAPATDGVSNVGSGAYGKLNVGGFSMYVNPLTPGADGPDWDLDLAEKLNANVSFTKVVPVPASGTAFFKYDPVTGTVAYAPAGDGSHNLFDAEVRLAVFALRVPLLNETATQFTYPNVRPKALQPHWLHRVTMYNAKAQALDVWMVLVLARESTS